MHICHRDFVAVTQLWDELAEFPTFQAREALTHCLRKLTHIIGASNASWMASIRNTDASPSEPTRGWWPWDIVVLHDSVTNTNKNQATLEQFQRNVIDPQSAIMIARAGTTRTVLRSQIVNDTAWKETWLFNEVLRPLGIKDRLVGAHAVNRTAESFVALDREQRDAPLDDRARDLLTLFLSGNRHFHREQLLIRGLVNTSRALTPREQDVMRLLLTDMSEAEIAESLELSFSTSHKHVMSIYHKFNVQGRAALAARWLRYRSKEDSGPNPPI